MQLGAMRLAVVPVLLGLAFVSIAGCSADGTGATDASVPRDGSSTRDVIDASRADTITPIDIGMPDTSCATIAGHADIVRRPLDVIVVVDSSNSFDSPRRAIANVLAPNLIQHLESNMIDYRVVVVGGAITAPPATDPPRYFFVSRSIGSGGLLAALPGHLRAAIPHLRMDALKAVIDFTDGQSGIGPASGFYTGMDAADLIPYFGTATMKRYIVHTVAGLHANMPASMPWGPMDPIVTTQCSGFSAVPCQQLQQISVDTGGYRFPLCNFSDFGSFFDAVAQQAISGVQVPCEFAQPTTGTGATPDIQYAVMTLTSGTGTMQMFHSVANMAACGDGFYLQAADADAGTAARVVLCPTTCAAVQADGMSHVDFSFECPPL